MMANALSGTTTEVGPPGFGLVGVAERVKMHGGRLTAGPTAAGQFEVNVWLPWKDTANGSPFTDNDRDRG